MDLKRKSLSFLFLNARDTRRIYKIIWIFFVRKGISLIFLKDFHKKTDPLFGRFSFIRFHLLIRVKLIFRA